MNEELRMWLRLAESDWAAARQLQGELTSNAVCFHVQQCIEKLLKANLIANGSRPPYTHSLQELSNCLHTNDPTWKWIDEELIYLTRGAVEMRYQIDDDGNLMEEAARALEIGERLRNVLRARLIPPMPEEDQNTT